MPGKLVAERPGVIFHGLVAVLNYELKVTYMNRIGAARDAVKLRGGGVAAPRA